MLVVGVVLGRPTLGRSKILRYVDANGVIWFTNVPDAPAPRDSSAVHPPQHGQRLRQHPFRAEVEQTARQYGLSPALVSALMAVESNFDPTAVSPKGAQGLMQLMPLIARYYRVYNPFDPRQNIDGGSRFLSDLLQLFDHRLPLALAAYNAGEGVVRRHGGVPPFLEAYVNRVLTLYEQLRGTSIYRYLLPSGTMLFSNVPLTQEQLRQWQATK
jgi:soluble lytic murein transglycosylase